MNTGILYVQVQDELSSLLLRCLDAKDKIEISRWFAHTQAVIKGYFFQGTLKSEEVIRLQQLQSMRYLLHCKKTVAQSDQQIAHAYTAVSTEVSKLLNTASIPSYPKPQSSISDILSQAYLHTTTLPESERISKTVAFIASVPHIFASDPLMRKILVEERRSDSPGNSLERSGVLSNQEIEESEEELVHFPESQVSASGYRSETLRRFLSVPHPD